MSEHEQVALHVNDGRVKVFSSRLPGPLELSEVEACRRLMTWPDLLATCRAVLRRLTENEMDYDSRAALEAVIRKAQGA